VPTGEPGNASPPRDQLLLCHLIERIPCAKKQDLLPAEAVRSANLENSGSTSHGAPAKNSLARHLANHARLPKIAGGLAGLA
jgi:hypothetical protein